MVKPQQGRKVPNSGRIVEVLILWSSRNSICIDLNNGLIVEVLILWSSRNKIPVGCFRQ